MEKNMNYRYYLFDFDYTLADSEKGITGCFHTTLKKLGYKDVADEAIRRTIGLPMEEAIRRIAGIEDADECERFLTNYRREADKAMTPNTHFYPETLPLLEKLRATGAKTAIISTKTRHRIMEKFLADGVAHLLDFIIGCEDVRTLKPSPEGILAACRRFDAAKRDVLYTGDNTVDAEAARAAGVDFAAVLTGTTERAAFEALPHVKIMKNLGELLA